MCEKRSSFAKECKTLILGRNSKVTSLTIMHSTATMIVQCLSPQAPEDLFFWVHLGEMRVLFVAGPNTPRDLGRGKAIVGAPPCYPSRCQWQSETRTGTMNPWGLPGTGAAPLAGPELLQPFHQCLGVSTFHYHLAGLAWSCDTLPVGLLLRLVPFPLSQCASVSLSGAR